MFVVLLYSSFFFFNDTATTEIYTLSLHDALPILLRGDSSWSLYAWVRMDEAPRGAVLIAGVGDPGEEYSHYLGVNGAKLFYWGGKDATFSGTAGLAPGKWQFVAATFDGQEVHIYANGAKVANGKVDAGRISPLLVGA